MEPRPAVVRGERSHRDDVGESKRLKGRRLGLQPWQRNPPIQQIRKTARIIFCAPGTGTSSWLPQEFGRPATATVGDKERPINWGKAVACRRTSGPVGANDCRHLPSVRSRQSCLWLAWLIGRQGDRRSAGTHLVECDGASKLSAGSISLALLPISSVLVDATLVPIVNGYHA